jgi:hypothetical protein
LWSIFDFGLIRCKLDIEKVFKLFIACWRSWKISIRILSAWIAVDLEIYGAVYLAEKVPDGSWISAEDHYSYEPVFEAAKRIRRPKASSTKTRIGNSSLSIVFTKPARR